MRIHKSFVILFLALIVSGGPLAMMERNKEGWKDIKPTKEGTFFLLPDEVIREIMKYISQEDLLLRWQMASKRFKRLVLFYLTNVKDDRPIKLPFPAAKRFLEKFRKRLR